MKSKYVQNISIMEGIIAGYQKIYTTVFNAVTQALEELEKQNLGAAKECLLSAQLMAEGIYLQSAGTEER